jgi:hypothetical protein
MRDVSVVMAASNEEDRIQEAMTQVLNQGFVHARISNTTQRISNDA